MGKKSRLKREKTFKTQEEVKTAHEGFEILTSNWKRDFIVILILAVSIFFTYSPSLKGTFTLDDLKIIDRINALNNFPQLSGFRSITYITFYLNKLISGLSAFNVRLTNILIHFISSLLVYLLALMTLRLLAGRDEIVLSKGLRNDNDEKGTFLDNRYTFTASAISALIFALHPLNINAVAYIVQRMASLAALFVLLSLILYIKASLAERKIKKCLFYSFSAMSLMLGILSKENAVMGVPLILLYDYVFLSKLNTRLFFKKIFPMAVTGAIVLIIVSVPLKFHKRLFELGSIFLNLNQPLTHTAWMTTDVSWTPLQHILTEFRVISRYIFLLFLPLPRFMVFDWWGYPVSQGLSTPPSTFLSILFISGILLLSIIKRRKYPFLFFGIAWYFIAISLESFVAVGADLYFEHRNYLPLSGLSVGLVIQSFVSMKSLSQQRDKILVILASVVILLLSICTFQRNFIWQDFLSIWVDTAEKVPSNTRAFVTVGKNYFLSSQYDMAEYYFKRSLNHALGEKQSYFYQESALFLGEIYLTKGKVKEAEEIINVFHRKVPASYKLMILKGLYLSKQNRLKEAIMFYNQALNEIGQKNKRIDLLLHLGYADIYRKTGKLKEAAKAYKHILEDYPLNSLAHYGLAVVYISENKTDEAIEHLDKTLKLYSDDILALSEKARLVLSKERDADRAAAYAQKALAHSPPFYEPYIAIGFILTYKGEYKKADEYFEKSKRVWSPAPEYEINYIKANAYSLKGDSNTADVYLKKAMNNGDVREEIKQAIRKRFFNN